MSTASERKSAMTSISWSGSSCNLTGENAGDYGRDTAGIAVDPITFARYHEAELVHARWAMLGTLGCMTPELLAKYAVVQCSKPSDCGLDYLSNSSLMHSKSLLAILECQMMLMDAIKAYCTILDPLSLVDDKHAEVVEFGAAAPFSVVKPKFMPDTSQCIPLCTKFLGSLLSPFWEISQFIACAHIPDAQSSVICCPVKPSEFEFSVIDDLPSADGDQPSSVLLQGMDACQGSMTFPPVSDRQSALEPGKKFLSPDQSLQFTLLKNGISGLMVSVCEVLQFFEVNAFMK